MTPFFGDFAMLSTWQMNPSKKKAKKDLIDVRSRLVIFGLFGMLMFFSPESSSLNVYLHDEEGIALFKFQGVHGTIYIGYLNVMALSILLLTDAVKKYKLLYITIFLFSTILTTQRSPIGGLFILLLFYVYQKKLSFKIIVGLFIALACVVAVFFVANKFYHNFELLNTFSGIYSDKFSTEGMA